MIWKTLEHRIGEADSAGLRQVEKFNNDGKNSQRVMKAERRICTINKVTYNKIFTLNDECEAV